MKTNIIAITGIGLLVLFALGFASVFEIRLASAQVDATSSPPSSTDSTTTPLVPQASTSTVPTDDVASSSPEIPAASTSTVAASAAGTSSPAVDQPPQGLTLVHIVGTKYTDYFTDGTTVTSYPGDPAINSNFDKPDAPIPTHAGLTWDHTTGGYLYDTTSGDLEVGDYAVQPGGSDIENAPPFVSSISTAPEIATSTTTGTGAGTSSTTSNVASPSVPDASTTTVPAPSDNSSSTASSIATSPTR